MADDEQLIGSCQDLRGTLEGVSGPIATDTAAAIAGLLNEGQDARPSDPVLNRLDLGEESTAAGISTLRGAGARVVLQQIEDALSDVSTLARSQSVRMGISDDIVPQQAADAYNALLGQARGEKPESEVLQALEPAEAPTMTGMASIAKHELERRLQVIEADLA